MTFNCWWQAASWSPYLLAGGVHLNSQERGGAPVVPSAIQGFQVTVAAGILRVAAELLLESIRLAIAERFPEAG